MSERVAEQVRRDLAELIRTELKDPRVAHDQPDRCRTDADYAHAKVFSHAGTSRTPDEISAA